MKPVLTDEPFGALDPPTGARLQDEYSSLHRRSELTTIMVTHDVAGALLMAERVGILQAGQFVAVGPPTQLLAGSSTGHTSKIPRKPVEPWDRLCEILHLGKSSDEPRTPGSGGAPFRPSSRGHLTAPRGPLHNTPTAGDSRGGEHLVTSSQNCPSPLVCLN